MELLGLLFALVIGGLLGLLGGGGSVLTVPVFVYVLGFGGKEAIAASLAVVGITSLFGALGHWRAGNVRVKVALVFGAFAMVGAFGGARLAAYVPAEVQLVLFGLTMLVAAYFMLRERPRGAGGPPVHSAGLVARTPVAHVAAEGVAVGALTGLVGVGGGFLIIPALVLLGGLAMKEAVGTSLVVISLKSITGFAGYLGQVEVPWASLGLFTLVAIAGILLGTRASHHVSQEGLKKGFAGFVLLMGLFVLAQNAWALTLA